MTRYRAVQISALALSGWAVSRGHLAAFVAVVAGALVVVGLGVSLPHLRFFGPFVCRGGSGGARAVALTFDDGPDPRSTPALLDLLGDAGVQAAFFCIGARVAEQPELTTRIAREGHLVENHSYRHSRLTNFFGVGRLRAELERTQAVIAAIAGAAPTCFRPPMGLSNPRVFRAARAVGLRVVGWTTRGFDTRLRDPERIVRRIARGLRPGAIVLLHDGGIPPERLLATVRRLLDEIATRGYHIVRLDRLLEAPSVAPEVVAGVLQHAATKLAGDDVARA